jgi:elongation factor Ts
MHLCRFLHTAKALWNPVAVEKAALSRLRKTTGYPFSKCKEALQKHENDVNLAEQWLKDQAQAHGWEKANKLQGRATAQGLVSIFSSPTTSVMIEMNCETDFVARNKKFQSLVQKITQGCYNFSNEQHPAPTSFSKIPLSGEDLANLPLMESRMVKDEIALSIGEIGENIKTRRAVCFKSIAPVMLVGYTHPAPESVGINAKEFSSAGKYGAIVAFRPKSTKKARSPEALTLIGRQLCQHVVGMNPREIGSLESPPPQASQSQTQSLEKPQETEAKQVDPDNPDTNPADFGIKSTPEIDETILVNQEFLLDHEITVRDFLLQNSIEVLDFVRFECGEVIDPTYCE